MGRACSKTSDDSGRGTRDAPGNGGHTPAPLREAQLPLRGRRGAAQLRRAQLLGEEQDEVRDAERRRGGAGTRGDQALQSSTGEARRSGGQGAEAADRQQATAQLKTAENQASSPFSASDALYQGVVGFLAGGGCQEVCVRGIHHSS